MTDTEYRRERKKVVVPAFFKRKIFIVLMLLITSAIMVGVATYAWFILSTAPEVTGVTATVGANGSLEIALLNSETGKDLTKISAKVGDSVSVAGKVNSNISWGNVVDLGDTYYGLNTLVLNPSMLNNAQGDDTKVDVVAMLSVPRNGTDGRIKAISADTVAAVYKNGAFTTKDADYGVRAIGTTATKNGNARVGYLNSAKNAFRTDLTSAVNTAVSAINTNGRILMSVAAGGRNGTYTSRDVEVIKGLVSGYKSSLDIILDAYKQAIIASAAANTSVSDKAFSDIRSGLASAEGNEYSNYVTHFPSGITLSDLTTLLNDIASAEAGIDIADTLLDEAEDSETAVTFTFDQVSPVISKLLDISALSQSNVNNDLELVITKDIAPGLMAEVAEYVGSYEVNMAIATLKVQTANQNGKGLLDAVDLSGYTIAETTPEASSGGDEGESSAVTTFYGYVVDLAFRTNVNTNLQLQTEAIDRIYTDGAGGTMGGGSTLVFTKNSNEMSQKQIQAMLSAVRVVFFDPDNGRIYATATAEPPVLNDNVATASLKISDTNVITALAAEQPQKISALFYLDGTSLDSMSVVNAKNSGTMQMNLQFSSSVELNPMLDDELRSQSMPDTPAAGADMGEPTAEPDNGGDETGGEGG